jgi:hypothetical protein
MVVQVIGDYEKDGFSHLRQLIPPEVTHAFMTRFKQATGGGPIPLSKPQMYPGVLKRPAFDVSSDIFKPMEFFLWGLAPAIGQLVGKEVLPSYNYFRIYREGDICKVHSDRPASQHGVSLTLDYSDGEIWDLQVGKQRTETLYPLADDFGSNDFASIGMEVGDAVLYQASHYPHGRIRPNPNAWSAHLFLFFVDRDGPYRDHALDGEAFAEKVNFSFV